MSLITILISLCKNLQNICVGGVKNRELFMELGCEIKYYVDSTELQNKTLVRHNISIEKDIVLYSIAQICSYSNNSTLHKDRIINIIPFIDLIRLSNRTKENFYKGFVKFLIDNHQSAEMFLSKFDCRIKFLILNIIINKFGYYFDLLQTENTYKLELVNKITHRTISVSYCEGAYAISDRFVYNFDTWKQFFVTINNQNILSLIVQVLCKNLFKNFTFEIVTYVPFQK